MGKGAGPGPARGTRGLASWLAPLTSYVVTVSQPQLSTLFTYVHLPI